MGWLLEDSKFSFPNHPNLYKRNLRYSMHTVEPTPLRTPTIVVVKAELTMVHKNMVKLRAMPITNERIRMAKKYKELLCIQGRISSQTSVLWLNRDRGCIIGEQYIKGFYHCQQETNLNDGTIALGNQMMPIYIFLFFLQFY